MFSVIYAEFHYAEVVAPKPPIKLTNAFIICAVLLR